ncbi:hypothetical protein DPMN_015927 [Dreissena polymorpha]|uniref:Uncharacterized protein n=1 Tax=Dreissena polymorpha TaxID=45954 RepID=A0A9D4NDK4_DREPO|nr:hypothetical protein DPMN_015927 [Dreissena polymorpha]
MWQQPGSQDIQPERVHQRHLFAESPLFIIDLRVRETHCLCNMPDDGSGTRKVQVRIMFTQVNHTILS